MRPFRFVISEEQELIKNFLNAIAIGLTFQKSCKIANVSSPVVYKWLTEARRYRDIKEGKIPDDRGVEFGEMENSYLEFLEGFEKAKLALELRCAAEVTTGIKGDPRFALDILSRLDPRKWGKKDLISKNVVLVNMQQANIIKSDGQVNEDALDEYIRRHDDTGKVEDKSIEEAEVSSITEETEDAPV